MSRAVKQLDQVDPNRSETGVIDEHLVIDHVEKIPVAN